MFNFSPIEISLVCCIAGSLLVIPALVVIYIKRTNKRLDEQEKHVKAR